ncbi:MAG TPA: regulatory iron-sulfur-containing complex subunit RicT [Gemmatimonadaceae bacterium]|nr:regulatory iron-sulfur-containing complex subunit RicT [Gemmatimonadaceae bacterium]
MSHLIEVAFKGNRKEFFLWEADESLAPTAPVIVDADRGEDLGRVHSVGELAAKRSAGAAHGLGDAAPAKKVRRVASADDVRRFTEVRAQDEDARRKAMERVKANQLVMKISDAEWQWDRKKLTFYFTAEKRVDFRNLVRELAAMFRTRIELKQIGVRDEAKRLDGIGRCGRQYCSSSWLPELRPVNLGVAKDQRLSLNPSQISGACGRLMCCLRYEHEFYVHQRKRFPKEGKTIRTRRGEEKIVANDIFRERVTLRGVDGEVRVLPLEELRVELEAAGAGPLVLSTVTDEYEAVDVRPEVEEESELTSAIDIIEEAPRTETAAPSEIAKTPTNGDAAAAEAPHKPHRRRGRRGGRRNRAGRERGETNGGGGDGGTAPPEA